MKEYAGVPEIKDENAKIRERMHYISGAQVIEINYGDGGYYLGILSDGVYSLLLWKHSSEEAKDTEYGPIESEEPLKEIEEAIRKKQEILAEARALMQGEEYDSEAADAILVRIDEEKDYNTPKEKEIEGLKRSMLQRNKKLREKIVADAERKRRQEEARAERDKEFGYRRDAKQELIKEAKSFADSRDYSKAAADRMRGINEEWKNIGPIGRKEEQALWKELRAAQDGYWNGKREEAAGKHKQWIDNTMAAIGRRENRVNGIKANLEKLRSRLETAVSDEKKEQIQQWISEDEGLLNTLTGEMDRMKQELERGGRGNRKKDRAATENAEPAVENTETVVEAKAEEAAAAAPEEASAAAEAPVEEAEAATTDEAAEAAE